MYSSFFLHKLHKSNVKPFSSLIKKVVDKYSKYKKIVLCNLRIYTSTYKANCYVLLYSPTAFTSIVFDTNQRVLLQ